METLEQLRRTAEQGRIQTVHGFGAKSERAILEAVAGALRARRRHRLSEAEPVALDLLAELKKAPGHAEVQQVLAKGVTRSSVVLQNGMQVDLRAIAPVSFGLRGCNLPAPKHTILHCASWHGSAVSSSMNMACTGDLSVLPGPPRSRSTMPWGYRSSPYDLDLVRVLRKAHERGCFLELNAQPARLDLDAEACRMARGEGVLVSINSDAHAAAQLANLRLAWVRHAAAGCRPLMLSTHDHWINCGHCWHLLWARSAIQSTGLR